MPAAAPEVGAGAERDVGAGALAEEAHRAVRLLQLGDPERVRARTGADEDVPLIRLQCAAYVLLAEALRRTRAAGPEADAVSDASSATGGMY